MRISILTEGHTNPVTAKTATSLIRYRGDEVVALIDATAAGQSSAELLSVGSVPVVARLSEAPPSDTLFIGIAPPGGKIPPAWRATILEAITHKLDIVSGLHDYLSDDAEFIAAAAKSGSSLTDVRKSAVKEIARYPDFSPNCLRVLTVGQDCSVGKMVCTLEVQRELAARGENVKFVATGQTGIMIAGDGLPLDSMVADFISGAAESLVLKNQQHDILLVEGQGSLAHPSYSGVTLGLLHGIRPQGLIFCFDPSRTHVGGLSHVPLRSPAELMEICLQLANLAQPAEFIGIALNTVNLAPKAAARERETLAQKTGLPVCDVIRDGPQLLADAVLDLQRRMIPG